MQPLRQLMSALRQLATPQACLFTPADLRPLLPDQTDAAFKTLLSRVVRDGLMTRICRGLYLYDPSLAAPSQLLMRAAIKLRPLEFNYLSLETVLSDAGVISQIPMNRIMVMSSGRSSLIRCGAWGTIEYVHTQQTASSLAGKLHYDTDHQCWRASVAQALKDMRSTHRKTDLIDWNLAHELV